MDLTKFNWANAGFIATTLDDTHHYEKEGLVLYVTYVALISTLLEDHAVFQRPEHFEAEIGYNEDGAYIIRTSREVAETYIREIMIKQQQRVIDLTCWDANQEIGELMQGTPSHSANIKATFIQLKHPFSYRKTKTKGAHTLTFKNEDNDEELAISSDSPGFQENFTRTIKTVCSVEQ